MGVYRIVLPYVRPPSALTGNARPHWSARHRQTREVRQTVAWLAKQAGIQPCQHLTVELIWSPGDRRKRDEDNLWPFFKVMCDGLARGKREDWTGLDLVPDDTSRFMTKKAPRIVSPDECPEQGMWLIVTTGEAA